MTLIIRDFRTSGDMDATHSVNADYDAPRTCIVPTRSQGMSILSEPFNSLSAWAQIASGSGVPDVIDPLYPDPMIGNVLRMRTLGTVGSAAGVQKTLSSVPNSFGLLALHRLNAVGTDPASALNYELVNNAGKKLWHRYADGMVKTHLDGVWQTSYEHGGDYWTEWWSQVVDKGDGTHDVELWAGTQRLSLLNGVLPAGTANLMRITQQSANANRESQVAVVNVGPDQRPDALTYCSPYHVLPASPTVGHVELWVENVSVDLNPNVNIRAYLSKDNLGNFAQVTLANVGNLGFGELDIAKNLVKLKGTANFVAGGGTELRLVVETDQHGYFPLQLAAINVDYP